MIQYKSTILTIVDPDDHDCPTCKFLQGDHSVDTLLKVIENLDGVLANEEEYSTNLLNTLIEREGNASTN